MTKRVAPLLAVAFLHIVACGGDDDVAKAPAPVVTSAGAGSVAPPPDVLAWSFEPASADCNGWPVQNAVGIRAAPPRTGAYSCKVCATDATSEVTLGRDVGALDAGTYRLSAWVRSRAATPAPPQALARIDAETAIGPVTATASPVDLREEWDHLETSVTLAAGASRFTIAIGSIGAGGCLFVDDVSVTRE